MDKMDEENEMECFKMIQNWSLTEVSFTKSMIELYKERYKKVHKKTKNLRIKLAN